MRTLVQNGLLIDGLGNQFPGSFVDICDNMIQEVGAGKDVRRDVKYDTIIDATGKTVIPGMINCHVHLGMNAGAQPMHTLAVSTQLQVLMQAIENVQKMVKNGITTVRDCGAKEFEILLLRDNVKKGVVPGPRILASQAIKITGGHFTGRVVDGPIEAKRAVREQVFAGVDFVKLMASGGLGRANEQPGVPELDVEEMQAAIREGKKHGLKACAHAHSKQSMMNAIEAGVDTLEHCTFLDDEVTDTILRNKIPVVPTFQPYYQISTSAAGCGLPGFMVETAKMLYAEKLPRFQRALKAGIEIAFGTDAGAPFTPLEDMVTETRIMVEMGMKPMEVIASCTSIAAKTIGLNEQLGSIQKGKLADIVLLNENPLENIAKLGDVCCVIQNGRIVHSEGMDTTNRLKVGAFA